MMMYFFRQFCISMFIHQMFSRFMMLTVIINCGFMTLSEPPPFVENVLEHVFMTIYTLECIVKVSHLTPTGGVSSSSSLPLSLTCVDQSD